MCDLSIKMHCYPCNKDFKGYDDFQIHILGEHTISTNFSRENSEDDSVIEIAALNTSEGNCHESDHSLDTEIKLDDNMDEGNTECEKNSNLDHTIAIKNKSKLSKKSKSFKIKPRKCKKVNRGIRLDESMNADNTMPGKSNDSDYTIATKNNSNVSKTASAILSVKSHDDEAETSVIKNTVLKKRCNKKKTTSKKLTKKMETALIIKKRQIKKQMTRSFSKKSLPKHKTSSSSHEKDTSENSVSHSASSFNPYGGQGMVFGNQAVQPPVYIGNALAPSTSSNNVKCFDFNCEYIFNWLTKFKHLFKKLEYPLAQSLFSMVTAVHLGIFDRYCVSSKTEEAIAVLKVYEELDCIIHKHINSINNALTFTK